MKSRSALKWLISLCLTLSLAACNDHRLVPSGQRFRLTSVSSGNSQEKRTVNYTYTDGNKLQSSASRFESRGAISFTTTQFNYDSQGRLITTEAMSSLSGSSQRVTVGYDAAGNLTSARTESFSPGNPVRITEETFTYGSGKYPTVVTSVNENFTATYTYTYTNENITQTSRTSTSPSSPPSTTVELFTYDDKINPYYGLVGIGYGPSTFSKNNVISAGSSYSYDSNGLLTQISTPGTPAMGGPSTTTYSYEFY